MAELWLLGVIDFVGMLKLFGLCVALGLIITVVYVVWCWVVDHV